MRAIEIYGSIASKDIIVDFLLSQGQSDFYFFTCSHYGTGAFLLSAEEQVSARAKYGVFRLFLEEEESILFSETIKGYLKDKTIKIMSYDVKEL